MSTRGRRRFKTFPSTSVPLRSLCAELNWFRWDKLKEQEGGLAHFVSALLHIRKTHWETRRRMYMG